MKPRLAALAFFGCLGHVTGCSSSSTDDGTSAESKLTGEHFPASYCEVFVDKASPHFDSHGVAQLTLYLKTPLDKLADRGGVKSVGYHAQEIVEGRILRGQQATRGLLRPSSPRTSFRT